jgi:hypothetical protein
VGGEGNSVRDRRAFQQLMTAFAETQRVPFSAAMLGIWWKALEPYSDELVTRAVWAHITDPEKGVYFPKPADIIGRCEEYLRQQRAARPNNLLPAPRTPPAPWVHRFISKFLDLSKKSRATGEPLPAESIKQLMDSAKREQREAFSTTEGNDEQRSRERGGQRAAGGNHETGGTAETVGGVNAARG